MVIRDIKPELLEIAKSDINEDPTRILDNLSYIQQWLITQTHLQCRTDEQWLLAFLRGCKYDLERTKIKLDNFYSTRSLVPEFFQNRDPFQPELQELLKSGFFLPLPTSFEPNGPRIIFSEVQDIEDRKVNFIQIMKIYFMLHDILLLEDDHTTIAGTFTLIDCEDLPLRYMLQITPALLRKFIYCIQDCYPIRIKNLYALKAPIGLESIFNIMKSFMSKKLKSRFHVYCKKKSKKMLCDILPQQYMLKELGGDNGSRRELIEYWKKKVESYRDWFIEDEKYHSIEKLRPNKKPKSLANVFGIADSFKNLNID